MKKYIVIGALAYAAWYFLIRQTPVKPVVVLPLKDGVIPPVLPGSTTDVAIDGGPTKMPPVYANPKDGDVLNMIATINELIPTYNSSAQFTAARTKLFLNSQPQQVECLMAPCPNVSQVSKDVEDKAKALIDQLDQYALKYKSMEGGTAGTTADGFFR